MTGELSGDVRQPIPITHERAAEIIASGDSAAVASLIDATMEGNEDRIRASVEASRLSDERGEPRVSLDELVA